MNYDVHIVVFIYLCQYTKFYIALENPRITTLFLVSFHNECGYTHTHTIIKTDY